jgi:hypothetical protein
MTSIPRNSVSLKPACGKQKDRSRAHASHGDLLALVCCLFIRFSRVFVGKVAKALRGDGVVDATGDGSTLGFVFNSAVVVGMKVITDL